MPGMSYQHVITSELEAMETVTRPFWRSTASRISLFDFADFCYVMKPKTINGSDCPRAVSAFIKHLLQQSIFDIF